MPMMPQISTCLTSHHIMSGQKYKEISAYICVYYPNSFCAMSTRMPKDFIWLFQEVIAFDKKLFFNFFSD